MQKYVFPIYKMYIFYNEINNLIIIHSQPLIFKEIINLKVYTCNEFSIIVYYLQMRKKFTAN